MKCVCPRHGSSLHTHACGHVRAACAGAPRPVLAESETGVICRTCLTPEVAGLLAKIRPGGIVTDDETDDEMSDASIDETFEAYHELNRAIGYGPVCTECLFAATGVDRRRGR